MGLLTLAKHPRTLRNQHAAFSNRMKSDTRSLARDGEDHLAHTYKARHPVEFRF